MKFTIILFCSLFSLSALAGMWASEVYKDYTIVADKGDISFRFSGEAGYSLCATDVEFAETLLKIQDGAIHREYLLKATTNQTGDSGECTGGPVILSTTAKVIKSKWYKLSKNNSTTIIVPSWVTIEVK